MQCNRLLPGPHPHFNACCNTGFLQYRNPKDGAHCPHCLAMTSELFHQPPQDSQGLRVPPSSGTWATWCLSFQLITGIYLERDVQMSEMLEPGQGPGLQGHQSSDSG